MIAAVLAAALASAPDPCSAPPAGPATDRPTAALYREVGEGERVAGRTDSAVAAYRAAVALDPSDAVSRAALESLCREQGAREAFGRGLALVQGGDCSAAAPLLEEAHRGGEPGAALLAGICRYELLDDARAAPLLRQAEAHPPSRETARFFLGLVALRRGRAGEAAALLDAAAADPQLAPLAHGLSRAARSSGRLVLSLLAESGWDSNADLTPGTSAAPSGAADGEAGLAAALTYAPGGARGPYARMSGALEERARFDAFDLRGYGAAAGWQLGAGRNLAAAEYGWDTRWLGGRPWLSMHRLLLSARLALSPALTAGLDWEGRVEAFRTAAADAHSGLRHAAEAEVALDVPGGWGIAAGWRGGHDGARSDALASWEHGPRLSTRKVLGPGLRASAELAFAWRPFDAYDADLGERRSDRYLDGSALLEWDLGDLFTLQVAVAARRAFSSMEEFEYTKVVPTVGLSFARGLL